MPKRGLMSQAENHEANEALPPLDPIIAGLLEKLPETETVWPKVQRTQWLDILSRTLDLVYREPDTAKPNEPAHAMQPHGGRPA